jgi:hypothetical protein
MQPSFSNFLNFFGTKYKGIVSSIYIFLIKALTVIGWQRPVAEPGLTMRRAGLNKEGPA